MKKLIFAALIVVIFAVGSPVFAQTRERQESEFYYVNVSLEKIWPYRRGYIVQYRKGLYQMGRAYLPSEWFTSTASKGEIITLPPGTNWPSMTVYYKNGDFSHVRLYVHRWNSHETWGAVPQNVNIDSSFDDLESIRLEFE
jgi:hypothetical protein